jgi:hypothetical protein
MTLSFSPHLLIYQLAKDLGWQFGIPQWTKAAYLILGLHLELQTLWEWQKWAAQLVIMAEMVVGCFAW